MRHGLVAVALLGVLAGVAQGGDDLPEPEALRRATSTFTGTLYKRHLPARGHWEIDIQVDPDVRTSGDGDLHARATYRMGYTLDPAHGRTGRRSGSCSLLLRRDPAAPDGSGWTIAHCDLDVEGVQRSLVREVRWRDRLDLFLISARFLGIPLGIVLLIIWLVIRATRGRRAPES